MASKICVIVFIKNTKKDVWEFLWPGWQWITSLLLTFYRLGLNMCPCPTSKEAGNCSPAVCPGRKGNIFADQQGQTATLR
jgi:hypothetical protein